MSDAAATPSDAGSEAAVPTGDAALCGDTLSDPLNCGACGLACWKGGCTAGVCDPLTITTLATGQLDPIALALDDTRVYWFNAGDPHHVQKSVLPNTDGSLVACALGGCDGGPTTLARGITNESAPIALDGTRVYFGELYGDAGTPVLAACGKDGCDGGGTPIADTDVLALAADGAHVYWSTDDGIASCVGEACVPTAITPAGQAGGEALAAQGGRVWWLTYEGDVDSCPETGCDGGVQSLGTGNPQGAWQLAVDADNVYWITSYGGQQGTLLVCPQAGCDTAIVLVYGLSYATSIATDGTNIYWTELGENEGQGRVAMCPTHGCYGNVTVLASGLDNPTAVAVDATHVYFATAGAYASEAGTIQVIGK